MPLNLKEHLLNRKESKKIKAAEREKAERDQVPSSPLVAPDGFKIMRSDTQGEEEIFPPSPDPQQKQLEEQRTSSEKKRDRRLSSRLSQGFHRKPSDTSQHVPTDLVQVAEGEAGSNEDKWELRASQLARANSSGGNSPGRPLSAQGRSRSPSVTTKTTDEDIQEAIRLHEAGDLKNSAILFKKLANPNGANNPLSQVLYGLALRHGWGVEVNEKEAITYLQAAAANSADIEQEALRAGMKKGGAARGELVLAIFELGNCFRHGWGTEQDPVAAFNYYLTAANLGDTDAMNETAWCYLHGYGIKKKDKYLAAKYYRLAEKKSGNKILGNSWIDKPKYDDPPGK